MKPRRLPMAPERVELIVTEIVSEATGFNPGVLCRDDHLVNDLEADSLDLVEIEMSLEDAFDIDITEAEINRVATVGQVIDLVVEKTTLVGDLAPAGR